jgi:hypothetical protein
MDLVQYEIESVQVEIRSAHAAIEKAVRERRGSAKDSPLLADRNAAIATAREALAAVELRLRKLYESKSDD